MPNFKILILIILYSFNTLLVAQKNESTAKNDSVFWDFDGTIDELNDNLSKLKDAAETSKELATRGQALEDSYDKAYFEYCAEIDAHLILQFKNDSLTNHTDFLKQSIDAIKIENAFLSEYADSIDQSISELKKVIGEIDVENLKLAAKHDSIAKELDLFAGKTMKVSATAEIKPFPYFVGRIEEGDFIPPEKAVNPPGKINKPWYPITPVLLDSSQIRKIIAKNEYELPVLVRIDLELMNRFNQRLQKYVDKLSVNMNELEKNSVILKRKNETLTENVLMLEDEADVWMMMVDSSRTELKRGQDNVKELIGKYNELMKKYFEKYKEQLALTDDIRRMLLQKANLRINKTVGGREK